MIKWLFVLAGLLILGGAIVACNQIIEMSKTNSLSLGQPTPPTDPYSPLKFGVPEKLGGYIVLAVLTEQNFPCMVPGEKRLVLQVPQTQVKDALNQLNTDAINQDIQKYHLDQSGKWAWDITGPDITRKEVITGIEKSAEFFKQNGCMKTGGPQPTQ